MSRTALSSWERQKAASLNTGQVASREETAVLSVGSGSELGLSLSTWCNLGDAAESQIFSL